jgi:Lipid A core - O-antigen ligase and related enzymes
MTPTRRNPNGSTRTAVGWCAGVMVVLPFLSNLPFDYDRFVPLLFIPALLFRGSAFATACDGCREAIDRWLLIAAAAVAIVAALMSARPAPALVGSATWVCILLGAVVARRGAHDPVCVRLLLAAISFGAALGCLAIWFTWTPGTAVNQFAHYGHARLFGLHMMIGTIAGLGWGCLAPRHRREHWLACLVAITNCGGMLWSGGRAPFLAVIAGVVIWLIFAPAPARPKILRRAALIFICGFLLSCGHWSPEPYLGWWNAIARSAAATSADELTSTRLSFWRVTWTNIIDAPWFGHGADSYRFIQPKQDGNQPHNWPLQLALDVGLFGAVPFGALLLRQAWRGLRPPSHPSADLNPQQVAAVAFTVCLIAGLLDGVFYHAVLLMPAALLGGMAGFSPGNSVRPAPPLVRLSARVSIVAACAVLSLHAYLVFQLWQAAPPRDPTDFRAQLLRNFPSSVSGIDRWLSAWDQQHPEVALTWAHWAQKHSDHPELLHVYAALLLSRYHQFDAAKHELERAQASAHIRAQPRLQKLLDAVRSAEVDSAERKP